jgi:hypothetical protein
MIKLKLVTTHVGEQIARYKEPLKYEEINRPIMKLYKILL